MAWKDLHRVGIVATLVGVFFIGSVSGQNLVPNPSFEIPDPCPGGFGQPGWTADWFAPIQGNSPDYFSSCATAPGNSVPYNSPGFQYANSGESYIGLFSFVLNVPEGREAVAVELNTTMTEGEQYVFKMYYSLSNIMEYSIQTLGYKLTDNQLNDTIAIVSLIPTFYNRDLVFQDTLNWRLLTDTITAIGNERFLTIANFLPDSLSDTLYLGPGDPAWDMKSAYYYIDDVSIIPLDSLLSADEHSGDPDRALSLYPNPNQGTFTVQLPLAATQEATMEVWSVSGQLVYSKRLYPGSNHLQLQVADGLYLYRIILGREHLLETIPLLMVKAQITTACIRYIQGMEKQGRHTNLTKTTLRILFGSLKLRRLIMAMTFQDFPVHRMQAHSSPLPVGRNR
jgi:hypothetical protein